jgi:hypothetical protein
MVGLASLSEGSSGQGSAQEKACGFACRFVVGRARSVRHEVHSAWRFPAAPPSKPCCVLSFPKTWRPPGCVTTPAGGHCIFTPGSSPPPLSRATRAFRQPLPSAAQHGPLIAADRTCSSEGLCAPGRTRTCGQVLRRHLLYPLSYGRAEPWQVTVDGPYRGAGAARMVTGSA